MANSVVGLWPPRVESNRARSVILLTALFLIGATVPFCRGAHAANTTSQGNIERPPVIDEHDLRFVQLSAGGEPFKKWVFSIVQDNYGFVWLGTDDGLYRYDGYTLKAYRHDPNNPQSLSENTVTKLYKDRAGALWIGTAYGGLNKLDTTQNTFTHYQHDTNDVRSLSDQVVIRIFEDHAGSLWIGTNGGLDRLDGASGHFLHYRYPSDGYTRSNAVLGLSEDGQGSLFVGSDHGLYKLDRLSGRLSHLPNDSPVFGSLGNEFIDGLAEDRSGVLWATSVMGSEVSAVNAKTGELRRYSFRADEPGNVRMAGVNSIREDHNGTLWLGTFRDGLLKFDRKSNSFIRYSPDSDASYPDNVGALFEDSEGNIWAGGHSGVSHFQTAPLPFVNYQHELHNPNSLRNSEVLSVHADEHGFLWIGTVAGLHRLDRKTGQIVLYQHDPKNRSSLSYNEVSAIGEDGSGGLWIGTHGGGLNRFDRTSQRFFAYRHNRNDPQSLSSDLIQCLAVDRKGVLWIGTHGGGLNRFDRATGHFKIYPNDAGNPHSLSEDNVREIFADREGTLWIGTNHGLNRFDRRSEQFTVYLHNAKDPASLSHNSIGSIYEDRQGTLWIGTRSGLDRFDRTSGKFKTFTTKDGLANDAIEAIREDRRGHLWLATHQGLSEFDPLTKGVRNYSETDGLPGDFVNPTGEDRSSMTSKGEMVFGSEHGVTVFDPNRLSSNPYVPQVVLTEFLLFSRPVLPARNSPLQQPIWAARSLTLNHKQSIFTLEFAALSYVAPERNRYRYRLEGFETQWNEVDSARRSATYTNLPAGNYLFKVQASNNAGVWNNKGVNLAITVLPAWWATWWFDSIATLVIVGSILFAYRSRVEGLRLQTARLESQVAQRTHELEIARRTAEEAKDAAEQANQSKTAFLANMSHELRNPLNAILGFSNLLREGRVSQKQRRDLDIINRSGEHLLSLINDVLDIAKIDAGRIVIENGPLDLSDLASGVMELMRLRAEEKGLELLTLQTAGFCQFVETDGEKLREVLINLVANAVKYTERGSVILRVGSQSAQDSQHCRLVLEVQDTGIGIAGDDHSRIFEPFVQAGKLSRQKGTGLGLAITRKFVELMGGTIQLESAPGKGSLFRVEIPVRKLERSDIPVSPVRPGRIIGLEPGQPEYRVLIVEDEEENWQLLERFLESAGFNVEVATDGATGIEKFLTWRPHFIWMDWRLPGINGLEATRRIRALDGGRDVKIAILSAFAFTEYREQALASGVDDFLSKPFRPEEIFDSLARHLGVRYRYREAPIENTTKALGRAELMGLPAELRKELTDAIVSLDNAWITKVIQCISEQDAPLGATLLRYAQTSTYSPILQALQSSETVQM